MIGNIVLDFYAIFASRLASSGFRSSNTNVADAAPCVSLRVRVATRTPTMAATTPTMTAMLAPALSHLFSTSMFIASSTTALPWRYRQPMIISPETPRETGHYEELNVFGSLTDKTAHVTEGDPLRRLSLVVLLRRPKPRGPHPRHLIFDPHRAGGREQQCNEHCHDDVPYPRGP
jgi:hypothetical protein